MRCALPITMLAALGAAACQEAQAGESPRAISDEARLRSACRPLRPQERCVAGPPRRAEPGRSRESFFGTDGERVYHLGRPERFDADSFRHARTAGCPLWLDAYAWDANDVYVPSPQSCGPASCAGPDYTGFYWAGLGVADPATFRWIGSGYGMDDDHVYYQWARGPLRSADRESFEVCVYRGAVALGRDNATWFHEGSPIAPRDALAL